MTTAILSYRNFCFDSEASIANDTGTFQSGAPLSNLLTPRLGQLAIASNIASINTFNVTFRPGSPSVGVPVRIIGLLNHNVITVADGFPPTFNMGIYDISGKVYYNASPDAMIFSNGADGSFQNHAFFVIPADAQDMSVLELGPLDLNQIAQMYVGVGNTVVCGTRDPYTGDITPARFQAGAVWAGPIFQPTNGISLEGFGQALIDNSRVVRSIGGQVWTTPEIRQRMCSVEFPGLLESEVYGLAPDQSLQQLATYCGVSRPLVVIPTSSDDELVYSQGIYGYCPSPPKWNSIEKTGVAGVKTRVYTGSLELIEAR